MQNYAYTKIAIDSTVYKYTHETKQKNEKI
jgi:hypothetical protein